MNALGFHIPKRFVKIVNVENCYLQKEPSNSIRLAIKAYADEHNLDYYDLRNKKGFLRTLIIRTSTTGEVMLILTLFREEKEKREALLDFISEKFPEITSLMYVINEKANDTITDQNIICYKGNDHFFEEMEGLKFKIGPKSFYQTNSEQAYELYKKTREYAALTGNEVVYDLYTGTGTIANFVAKNAKKVIGVEYIPEAIEDAKINSEINGIKNTHFFAGDLKDVLTQEFIDTNGRPDVIILDPPRAGMHPNVIAGLLYAKPERIVYVSCNPATQARDLSLLSESYKVEKTQREYFLREQLKAIHKELGEEPEGREDIAELLHKPLPIPSSDLLRQLADLLDELDERSLDAPAVIAFEIDLLYQPLKLLYPSDSTIHIFPAPIPF